MISNTQEADAVILALDSLSKRAGEIINRIHRQQIINALERVKLQGLYGELKNDLQEAAIRGRILSGYRVQTDFERFFFVPAVTNALKSLRPRNNTNPITSNWIAALTEAIGHLDQQIQALEKALRDD